MMTDSEVIVLSQISEVDWSKVTVHEASDALLALNGVERATNITLAAKAAASVKTADALTAVVFLVWAVTGLMHVMTALYALVCMLVITTIVSKLITKIIDERLVEVKRVYVDRIADLAERYPANQT